MTQEEILSSVEQVKIEEVLRKLVLLLLRPLPKPTEPKRPSRVMVSSRPCARTRVS